MISETKLNTLNILFRFFPTHWIKNKPRDKNLDYMAFYIIENELKPDSFGSFTITFKGYTFWVENYPYAYGSLHDLYKGEFIMGSYAAYRFRKYIRQFYDAEREYKEFVKK